MPDSSEPPPRSRAASRSRAGRRSRTRRPRRKSAGELRGRLRAHDPFELIRWLALSQPDPRKALAELVQNSLDAGARTIRLTRRRDRGEPCLWIFDDGEGVIPELDRQEALRYIATHIGHSRKRDLSPEQRLRLLTQGQYGIGLLGFWSLGEMLEMRTAVPGQRPQRLILYRDRPDYVVEPLRGRLAMDERWTEVVVVGLHREAMSALVGRRAADYLASELRGQLLAREVDLIVEDRMSRGRAEKLIHVRPRRFLGERIDGIGPVEVPGRSPIRLEVYLAEEKQGNGGEAGLALYCSGTLVAGSFRELAALGLDHSPWTDARLTGLVDFPDFTVAPGSRRGVTVDEASGAFAAGLRSVEPRLTDVLESVERRRTEELEKSLVRDLQRAYRDFFRHRPRYAMLPVQSGRDAAAAGSRMASGDEDGERIDGTAPNPGKDENSEHEDGDRARPSAPVADLLPPGPLVAVKLTPSPVVVECSGARVARAEARDAAGRPAAEPIEYRFDLTPAIGALETIEDRPDRIRVVAGGVPATGSLRAVATSDGIEVAAEVAVEVVEQLPRARGAEGIPEPELVHHPGAQWRSRMLDGRWQVNTGHRDYRTVADRPSVKLRYLAMLFAKEVVLRSHNDPRLEQPLEQLVEVAGYADRAIASRRPGRNRKKKP
jgi:hypothetical protein